MRAMWFVQITCFSNKVNEKLKFYNKNQGSLKKKQDEIVIMLQIQ